MCSIASTSRRSTATGVWRASSDCDAFLDPEVAPVDVVVERDHVVGELDVALRRARSATPRKTRRTSAPSSWRLASSWSSSSWKVTRTSRCYPKRPVT